MLSLVNAGRYPDQRMTLARRLLVPALCTVIGTSAITDKSFALQPEALIPLAVVQVQDVPHNPDTGETSHIAVTIRNTGTKLIVAWGLRSEARLANSKVLRSFVTADAYENVGRSPTDPSLLLPNQQSAISMNSVNDDAAVVDIVAMPAFAIFDDDTAVGLSAEIEKKFAGRVASIRVYRAFEQVLSDTSRAITDPIQAARADRASLEAITDNSVTSHWSHHDLVQRLTSIIDSSRPMNKKDAMSRLIDEIRSRHVAAETHSQRRY
jgi:hypothetical protein